MEIADSYLYTVSFSSQNEEHDKKQRIDEQKDLNFPSKAARQKTWKQ